MKDNEHLAASRELREVLLQRKVSALAYETVLNTYRGALTNQAVGEAHGLEWMPLPVSAAVPGVSA